MFKVREIYFRCVLRGVCNIVHLSWPSIYLVFDLNFYFISSLQKIAKLTFSLFFLFSVFPTFVSFEEIIYFLD